MYICTRIKRPWGQHLRQDIVPFSVFSCDGVPQRRILMYVLVLTLNPHVVKLRVERILMYHDDHVFTVLVQFFPLHGAYEVQKEVVVS